MSVTLTEAAARHINRYLTKRGKGVGVRLGVKTTGCSGLAYKLEYVDEVAPEDLVFEDQGVKVLVDPKSLAYIDGTQLDFVREGLNEGFKFLNPNERDRLKLQDNDFELFELPQQFEQDSQQIAKTWQDLQRQAHPDKFAAHGAAAQRLAMQWSVRINEAYQRLRDPLKRAAYLCELQGAPIQAESNTAMPAAFLMQQMAWREALEEASSVNDIDHLEDEVMQARRQLLADSAHLLDRSKDFLAAAQQVRALMFLERFAQDIEKRREALESRASF
jgi:molecular chaperone HscB